MSERALSVGFVAVLRGCVEPLGDVRSFVAALAATQDDIRSVGKCFPRSASCYFFAAASSVWATYGASLRLSPPLRMTSGG